MAALACPPSCHVRGRAGSALRFHTALLLLTVIQLVPFRVLWVIREAGIASGFVLAAPGPLSLCRNGPPAVIPPPKTDSTAKCGCARGRAVLCEVWGCLSRRRRGGCGLSTAHLLVFSAMVTGAGSGGASGVAFVTLGCCGDAVAALQSCMVVSQSPWFSVAVWSRQGCRTGLATSDHPCQLA